MFLLCRCFKATRICRRSGINSGRNARVWCGSTHLSYEEFGDALRQATLLAGQDHLEHVTFQLLHDDEDALARLKHAFQVDDTRMRQVLQDRHLVLELIRLFGREAKLVDHFDGDRPVCLAVSTWNKFWNTTLVQNRPIFFPKKTDVPP